MGLTAVGGFLLTLLALVIYNMLVWDHNTVSVVGLMAAGLRLVGGMGLMVCTVGRIVKIVMER